MKRTFSEIAKIYDKRDRLISVGNRNSAALKTHPLVVNCHKAVGTIGSYRICAGFDALIKMKSMSQGRRIVIKRTYSDGEVRLVKPSKALEYALKKYTKIAC